VSDRRRPPDAAYASDLPPEHVERIRRWHEEGLRAARAEAGSDGRTFDYLGLTLYVPPQVQPIYAVSHLLGEAVLAEVRPGDRVLDMGTGCGVNAILAARAGADVLALDVNPEAVRAARDNARRNGVANRLEVRLSDVFDAVDPASDGPFDVVMFDPPFRWFQPRDLLEMATADPGYRALTRFVREARLYLSDRGRLLIFFGSSGDLGYLQRLVAEEGWRTEVLARKTMAKDDGRVEYITYRLAPRTSVGASAP
jgi:release factor glutamine methyltransferase